MTWQEWIWSMLAAARLTGMLLLRRRRILFLGILVLLPALLPVVVAALRPPMSQAPWGLDLYTLIAEYGFLSTLAPLGAILLGTALMGDDLESGTATYLLTRPAPRLAIVVGKSLAYALVMAAAFLPAMVLTFLSVVLTAPGEVDLGAGVLLLARTFGVVCLGIVAYGAFFGLLGIVAQRPVIYSATFVFGWEPLTRLVPGYVDFLTIKKHLLALWPTVTLGERAGTVELARKVIDVGVGEASFTLAGLVVVFAGLATITLRKKEFVRGSTLG